MTGMSVEVREVGDLADEDLPVLGAPLSAAAPAVVAAAELPRDWPAGAVLQADGSVIYTLAYPFTCRYRDQAGVVHNDPPVKTLHLQRLKGRHRKELSDAAKGDDFRAQMIASSARVDLAKAMLWHNEMDEADIAAVLRVVGFFMRPGLQTGS
jgi:hypothetical protein